MLNYFYSPPFPYHLLNGFIFHKVICILPWHQCLYSCSKVIPFDEYCALGHHSIFPVRNLVSCLNRFRLWQTLRLVSMSMCMNIFSTEWLNVCLLKQIFKSTDWLDITFAIALLTMRQVPFQTLACVCRKPFWYWTWVCIISKRHVSWWSITKTINLIGAKLMALKARVGLRWKDSQRASIKNYKTLLEGIYCS